MLATRSSGAATSALGAVGLWVVLEFAVRDLGGGAAVYALGRGGYLPRTEAIPELVLIVLWVATGVALLVLGGVFWRRAQAERLSRADLGYEFSRRALAAGILAGAVLFALTDLATGPLDERLSGVTHEMDLRIHENAGVAFFAVSLPINALLAPLVEEFAWRGYIQTKLVGAWGAGPGLLATAFLFAAKHVVVDLSLDRVVTLGVGSLALGLARQRWGTAASTLAHAGLNLTASIQFMLASLK